MLYIEIEMANTLSQKMITQAQKCIGYVFKDKSLLVTALTHSSYDKSVNYEKLEFLGDSILQFAVSDFLFKAHSYLQEGDMTIIRAYAVCEDSLYNACIKMGLDKFIVIGSSGISSAVNKNRSVVADIFESVSAAIYLDSGFSKARSFVISNLNEFIVECIKSGDNKDSKTKLQHLTQSIYRTEPSYLVSDESGPAHDKTFVVQVNVNGNVLGDGKGKTKKEAQQQAALQALKILKKKGIK